MQSYSAIHCHSHYSKDGISSINQWVTGAKKKGLYGLAITDHGDCSSLLELYTIGKKEKFPITMGCEIYLIENFENNNQDKKYYHLTVLVKNFKGYQNLCKLSTIAYQRDGHFYNAPRVSFAELFDNKEGLVICSGCLAGPLCWNIIRNTGVEEDYVKEFHSQFKDDYYIEIQPSIVIDKEGEPNKQEVVNKRLIELSKIHQIPLVITPDAHIIDENHKILQDIKLNSKSNKKWDFDQSHFLFTPDELYQKVKKEHEYMIEHIDEAMLNSNKIIDKTQFDMPEFDSLLPNVDITTHELYEQGDTQDSLFMKIISNNGRINLSDPKQFDILKYEYNTLFNNGVVNFLPYFLLLEDVVRWCGKNNVTVGPGRGSASGSLIAYGLKITHLDPIHYQLSFDRFINKGRIVKGTYPDIDMDFSDPHIVKKYISEKYGEDHVALMGTIQTLKVKGALKDVLGLLKPDMSFEDKNELTASIPQSQPGEDEVEFFKNHLANDPKLAKFLKDNIDVYDAVFNLLGQCRQKGAHPCGLVVSSKKLVDIMPLWYNNGEWVTQYTADWCKKAGVVKYDFLGLNTLKDISGCLDLIKKNHGIDIDPYSISWTDRKTLDAFANADTDTVFQFHTHVAKGILNKMNSVSGLEDLAAITALGRPGPMDVGMDAKFIARKNGTEPIEYPHSSLEGILKDTYGIMVYQEQVMLSVQNLGGFSLEESDEVRRAMGSKNKELLNSYKSRFIDYAVSNFSDIDDKKANIIWDQIESFARYGFNKSHSVAYAMIGYICQYLRQYYPLEWYCSVFSNGSNEDQKNLYPLIKDLMVLPDINLSKDLFYIKDSKIVMSLSFIHGLGDRSVENIILNQPYSSFEDFWNKIDRRCVKKDVVINLIFADAFKNIEPDKSINQLLDYYFGVLSKLRKVNRNKFSEYDNLNQIQTLQKRFEVLPIGDLDFADLFKDIVEGEITNFNTLLNYKTQGHTVSIVGKIEDIKLKTTKKGQKMAFVTFENQNKKVRVTVWPGDWNFVSTAIKKEQICQVWGDINIWNGSISLVMKQIKIF